MDEMKIGDIKGRLTILNIYYEQGNNQRIKMCLCKCECGNYTKVNYYNLRKGATKSCGCLECESRYGRNHSKLHEGDTFGDLTLVRDSGQRAKNQSIIWECRCVCGNIVFASAGDLIRGRKTSCGCKFLHGNASDLTGKTFGYLTVLKVDTKKRQKGEKLKWICQCVCGKTVSVLSGDLVRGSTHSCGCKSGSVMSSYIEQFLKNERCKYYREYSFPDCKYKRELRFDFYLPEYKCALEYDGKQHSYPIDYFGGEEGFKIRQQRDCIKNEYCREKGIRLIRILYTAKESDIDKILYHTINKLNPVTSKISE